MILHCFDCGNICMPHYCAPCEVLNPLGIEIYCPTCKKHPSDFIENVMNIDKKYGLGFMQRV